MYVTLFSIVLGVGLLCVILPFNKCRKWMKSRTVTAVIRIVGVIWCMIGLASIYAVLSGKIVLPLIK